MTSATDAKGNVTNYTYNNKDQLTSVSQGGISVSYAYDSNNQLSTITHNGFTYNFIYDALGRSKQTKIGTRLLVDNMYEAETGLLQKSTYGNGDTREYEYDSKHRVTKLKVDGVDRFTYNYDNLGNLHSYTDLVQNITYTYLYDFLGRPVQVRTSSGFRIKLTYDEFNRASDVKFEFGSDALSTSWIYGKSSVVYGVKYNNVEKLSYTYDSLMRRFKTTINTTTPFVTTYDYKDISLDKTTTQLNSISYSNGKGFVYTYDANGNILTIKDQNNTLLANYTYDALNQLTREDNAQLNKTITYTYDNGGNILSIKEYAFTTGELGSVTNEKTYTYSNTEWKDLLTNYNGTDISYDTIGNPLNWINGETFTWSGGRHLTGITKGNTNISYTYNDGNIRTSKTVNGVRTDYYLNGTTIIMQKTGDNCIWFTYDENGLVSGFRYNGGEYYYIKNAQGDIIGIIDSSGTVVANYTYDSWGNHISITDGNGNDVANDLTHIANVNPFRYRGYYFDNETGLYYLNSRYYDANIGRWINIDNAIAIIGGTTKGYNLFCYCFNSPINARDPGGNWPKWIKDAIKWCAKETKPYIEKVQNAFSKIDMTFSQGINISGTPSAFIFNLQAGISVDTKGNIAVQGSAAGGVTGGSPAVSITGYKSVTNAPSIDKLDGFGCQVGGSIAALIYYVPIAAGGDINIIPDSEQETAYFGLTGNVGFGTPGGEVHVEWGETATWNITRFNIFDVVDQLYIKIMEW